MSRKPIDKQQPSQCRQAIWDEVRNKEDWTFTAKELDVMLDASTIREYLAALAKAGYLQVISEGKRGESNVYRLINDVGHEAPRIRKDGTPVTQGNGRLQMWNAMRIIKQFTPVDLAFNATTDEVEIAESEARNYCQALHRAGYLSVKTPAKTGLKGKPGSGQATRYMLIPTMWTGPQPPQIQRTKQIYDPNLKKVVWSKVEGGAE
ncbi:hypothetical protein FY034_13100 [Trichlorobacter lovleyi]|uniref:hypothetical protein n=1 Tax=Trichlorobacter lovleyi TaxID=313985 RepID=UPI00223FE70C|nr:hypothetical protein [Trichlorobacter lovleyi]QOX79828.1 hypothetical protein FY034_13100 [Trichlorobacter lovleyi]